MEATASVRPSQVERRNAACCFHNTHEVKPSDRKNQSLSGERRDPGVDSQQSEFIGIWQRQLPAVGLWDRRSDWGKRVSDPASGPPPKRSKDTKQSRTLVTGSIGTTSFGVF
jgi:hypothetical protein